MEIFLDIQVEKEQISPVEYSLKVTVPAEEVAGKVEDAITSIQRRAQIPGFRPGKVPRNVVLSKYGQAITAETVEELLQEAYRAALEKEALHPVVPGQMSDIQFEIGTPLSFTARVEVLPEIVVPDLKDISVELAQPQAADEDILAALDNIREANGTLLPTDEGAKEDSVISVDLQEVDAGGIPVIGRSQKDVEIDLSRMQLGEDFASKINGVKSGQTITVDFPLRGEGKAVKTTRMQVAVKVVKERELPALDDTFARSVNSRVETLDELKRDIRGFIEARAAHRAKDVMFRQLVESMLHKSDFPVPPGLIEDYLTRATKDAARDDHSGQHDHESAEFREKHRTSAIWNLKWYLLRSRLIAQEKIEVSALEMDAEIERLAAIEGATVAEFRGLLKKEHKDHIREDILERKVFQYLEEQVVIVPKPISLAEFEGRTPSRIVSA
jgi:trigger factor